MGTESDIGLPFVSVIVPVRDTGPLRKCVSAIIGQDYPSNRFELIIAENNPEPPADWLPRDYPQVKTVSEPIASSYRARNTALTVASGDVLAFTDADCVPHRGWLSAAVSAIMNGADVVAGQVRVTVIHPGRPHPVEAYDMVRGFPQDRYADEGWSVTANMVTTRSVMDTVGPFLAELKAGGDREWGLRASAAGFRPTYVPTAAVDHPARSTFREKYRKLLRVRLGRRHLEELSPSEEAADERTAWRQYVPPYRAIRRGLSSNQLTGLVARVSYVVGETYIRYASMVADSQAQRRLALTAGERVEPTESRDDANRRGSGGGVG